MRNLLIMSIVYYICRRVGFDFTMRQQKTINILFIRCGSIATSGIDDDDDDRAHNLCQQLSDILNYIPIQLFRQRNEKGREREK